MSQAKMPGAFMTAMHMWIWASLVYKLLNLYVSIASFLLDFWPTDVSVEAILIVRTSVCPCVTTIGCGETAQRIELIFGTDFPMSNRIPCIS